ncbi:MAG: response regulator transcription factor [Brumimicrobium sp.]|nr:response regulator transcription factor [Brumimicrobium sp.]MCO5269093.1 response regulator transcription factor [Brumimicrobium sp.]
MKVVIADSNEIVRIGLHTILSSDAAIELVGEANSEAELYDLVCSKSVDLVVLDYTSPNYTLDVVPEILKKNPHLKIVAITPEQNPTVLMEALKSGVASYIKKDCDRGEILDSVKETYAGNKFFCGKIMDTIRRHSIDVEHLDVKNFSCAPVMLSEREMEIIKYIAEGSTNVEIAEYLHLSQHTVNTHRKNIMTKLGTKNTAGLVMYAVKSNIVSPNKFTFTSGEE